MNLLHLRAFHAVAAEESFTRAAAALQVSQPTLSAQVRSLERHHGVQLFDRRGRRVSLTDAGRELLAVTRRLFDLEREAETCLSDARGRRAGRLRLAAAAPVHLMPLLAALDRRFPGVDVSLATGNSADLLRDLLDYRVDVAVVANVAPDPRLTRQALLRQGVVALLPRGHRWGRRRAVAVGELAAERLVLRERGSMTRQVFEAALASSAAPAAPRLLEVDGREAVEAAVRAGLGIGIVAETERSGDQALRALPVRGLDDAITEYLVCLAERRQLRLVQLVFALAAELRAADRR